MEIFKKKKKKVIITGLLALTLLFSVGCSDRNGRFAGADGRVEQYRETGVSEGLVTEIGEVVRDKAGDVGTVLQEGKNGIERGLEEIRSDNVTSTKGTASTSRTVTTR